MKWTPDDDRRLSRFLAFFLPLVAACVACLALCGCSSPSVSDPKYPEYDKWWTGFEPRRSATLPELGQGDILVFDNGQEVILL